MNNCPPVGKKLKKFRSCTISITFTPTGIGDRTGQFEIFDKIAGSPQIVSLDGTGITNATPTATATAATPTATGTPPTPTATGTPATPTATGTPATPTATGTPPTPTATGTPATPTATGTPATPTATGTPATPTATGTPAAVAISSLSENPAPPLSILTITGSGFDPTTAQVSFAMGNFSILTPPFQASSTSLVVSVPPFVGSNGITAAGTAQVQIVQSSGQSNAVTLQVQDLPSAPPVPPGTVVLGFLQGSVAMATTAQANLGISLSTLSYDVSTEISTLDNLVSLITPVVNGTASTVDLGTLNGTDISLTTVQLAQADRVLLAVLQSLGTSAGDSPAARANNISAATGCPAVATAANSMFEIINNGTASVAAVSSGIQNINAATEACALTPLTLQDAYIGLGGGALILGVVLQPEIAVALGPAFSQLATVYGAAGVAVFSSTYLMALNNVITELAASAQTAEPIDSLKLLEIEFKSFNNIEGTIGEGVLIGTQLGGDLVDLLEPTTLYDGTYSGTYTGNTAVCCTVAGISTCGPSVPVNGNIGFSVVSGVTDATLSGSQLCGLTGNVTFVGQISMANPASNCGGVACTFTGSVNPLNLNAGGFWTCDISTCPAQCSCPYEGSWQAMSP